MKTILVTGGAGFIGSHTCVELLSNGFAVIVIDNLCNASAKALERVQQITGKSVTFFHTDLLDKEALVKVFQQHPIDAVMHFAALKAVGESTQHPLQYYQNNLISTLNLIETMQQAHVYNLVFSSSATVYGEHCTPPCKEDTTTSATNPYSQTKVMIERFLEDIYIAQSNWKITILRYFNPVGAHPSGLIGEDPNGIPNNLMPFISQVAVGKREKLFIFGNDYPTPDGTGVRDYIHVVDVAQGHVKALQKLAREDTGSLSHYNLGAGKGYSVLEVIHAFEQASKQTIPYEIASRRAGDVAELFADVNKAARELAWQAQLGLDVICGDTWRWQQNNPNGYR